VPTLKEVDEVYLRAVCNRHQAVTQEQIDSLKVFCAQKLGIQVELVIFPKKCIARTSTKLKNYQSK